MTAIKNPPHILIIGETFHTKSGGGITLNGLFSSYPSSHLFNAMDSQLVQSINRIECGGYYSIGDKEKRSFFKKIIGIYNPNSSGEFTSNDINKIKTYDIAENKTGITNKKYMLFIKNYLLLLFKTTIQFLGLNQFIFKYRLSDDFLHWIKKCNPDIIYTQLSSRASIKLITEIWVKTEIPLAIHIMDDWPSTIDNKGLFKNFRKNHTIKEFKFLIEKAVLLFSISEGMSREYYSRYNKYFKPYFCPVNIELWDKNKKNNYDIVKSEIKVIYSGRIGYGNTQSLFEVADCLEKLNKEGYKFVLEIQFTGLTEVIKNKLESFSCIKINREVDYIELPKVLGKADILVLPYDFDGDSKKFIKLSMPTKASEYMISGVPILLYASDDIYIVEHALANKWALVVKEHSDFALRAGFLNLINSSDLRLKLGTASYNFAKSNYDKEIVSEKFKNEFKYILTS